MASETETNTGIGTSEFKTASAPTEVARLTAYKVWLSDIKEKEFKQEQGLPDYLEISGKKISRANIIASVIDKFDSEKFSSLTLDDGSAQLMLKAFGDSIPKLKNISTGDIILTISRLRNYNNETYLLPEVIKKVDSKYALLRRLELIIEYGKRDPGEKTSQQSTLPADTETDNLKERIKTQIAKLDEGEGVETSLLQEKFPDDKEKLSKIIDDFLSEGEAYEPRPGKIKLI